MPAKDDALATTDIIIQEVDSTRVRQRSPSTVIHSPNGGAPVISYNQEQVVEINGAHVATRPCVAITLDFATQVAPTMLELTDPVTNEIHKVSGAFIGQWIRAHYVLRAQNPI